MSLRVAVQMDPIETINIAGDSSFALMLSAQARGATMYHYDVSTLAYDEGRITAWACPITVQRVVGNHYTKGEYRKIDLATDVDDTIIATNTSSLSITEIAAATGRPSRGHSIGCTHSSRG